MMRKSLYAMIACVAVTTACSPEGDLAQYGGEPRLPAPESGLLPAMKIAEPAPWNGNVPLVPEGYIITAFATDLRIPRQILVTPNGDILVAEGAGVGAPKLRPKDVIAGIIKGRGHSKVEGGDRVTLLRDTNGDGRPELRTILVKGLNAPYGLAYSGGSLYVANQDALYSYPYAPGQTRITAAGTKVTELPSALNHHWTKALAVSADGSRLYVGIGSNSNITERGMAAEVDRAMIWEVDPANGAHRPYATGLRNPSALAIEPGTGRLWAAVNERDELGANLVPDYITGVREGAFYGWPYSYWGQHVDPRVHPGDPQKVASAVRPDYSLGSHVAPLGIAFSGPSMGKAFAEGVFVGQHGSWNRRTFSGYKVVFVPFRSGRPAGEPVDFVSGFLDDEGDARGRPAGVAFDPRGVMYVADDLSNTIWRVVPIAAVSGTQ